MYIPTAFRVNDQSRLVDFIKGNSFGILFSQEESGPSATHLPFFLDEKTWDNGVLISHMAKQNPHWKKLNGKEVLVVFQGPHAYISASWYKDPNTVPTWNYVAVHVYGTVQIIEKKEEMVERMEKTVHFYESSMPDPWDTPFDDEFIDGLMNGIVVFEISINKMEGKWKLSQNHSIERQQNVINGLKTSGQYQSAELAKIMEQNMKLQR
ncbi:FMN-binding negative transcriptional regulator [Bacillus sp. FSL W8-0223]|uniref:FMN-binding negative transcriptional regulator n=1 Tax=Bacillus sp. FSL W8-0223 TaxID=2954595 RepID=UPI0030FB90C1